DATTAILAKLGGFRGESRFTTWAYKFAVLEVSARLRRRAWKARQGALDEAGWGRLADPPQAPPPPPHQPTPPHEGRQPVQTTLTHRQRSVFLAAVAGEIPLDVIAERTGSSRGAVYKMLHDARRKLRASLVATGHLEAE